MDKIKGHYLKKMWARMTCDGEERINFSNILDMYLQKIKAREETI